MLTAIGAMVLRVAEDAGGMAVIFGRLVNRFARWRFDRDELLRSLWTFGNASLPIVLSTASFVGMIMVLQAAVYVQRFAVYNLVGWFVGFSVMREVAPVLIGLMFSGRVGANNTSELATMRATEKLDALRILALDVFELVILPRTLGMVIALVCLIVFGDCVALVAGGLCARVLMGVSFWSFVHSIAEHLGPRDFLVGVAKAGVFGVVMAVVSTHFGLSHKGGSEGVGRAVNAQVVASAVCLVLVDYLMSSVVV